MWDKNGEKILAGDLLRDVRSTRNEIFVLVTQVVYNTCIKGRGTHQRTDGTWMRPYPVELGSLDTYEVVVPGAVRSLLGEINVTTTTDNPTA